MTDFTNDITLLVPGSGADQGLLDPEVRCAKTSDHLALERARVEFAELLGRGWPQGQAFADGRRRRLSGRSSTALTLATNLERARLDWRVLDPGTAPLRWWGRKLREMSQAPPRVLGISTTFVTSGAWLRVLCATARRALPRSTLVVGGQYYLTSMAGFLGLDADIHCVGEAEERIVEIVRAVLEGRSVGGIPGLYHRVAGGELAYTGDAPALDLETLAAPDWSLVRRIEPSADQSVGPLMRVVETQRGCRFHCAFCTFRAMAAPVQTSPERAVELILDAASAGAGPVYLIDATATHPKDRWREIMRLLAARGGSPRPLRCFARVADVDEDLARMMALAGVRTLLVGQESGDQRILNLMRKGTRVEQVARCVRACAAHGIDLRLCFIVGFPGETRESIRATREMILHVNDGFEDAPVVSYVSLSVFRAQGGASIGREMETGAGEAAGDPGAGGRMRPAEAMAELLRIHLAVSRVSHAPSTSLGLREPLMSPPRGEKEAREVFRRVKRLDRGVGLVLESHLEGRPYDEREMRSVKEGLLAWDGWLPLDQGLRARVLRGVRRRVTSRLRDELSREQRGSAGVVTRALVGWEALRVTLDPGLAFRASASGDLAECLCPSSASAQLSDGLSEGGLAGRPHLPVAP